MSTIKTINVQHPNASSPAIILDSAGAMTGSFPYPNRNLIYNGACQINQRSASVASITTSDYRTADRWYQNISSLGTWTQTVENDAPTGSGFRKSLKLLCTTADAAPAASDVHAIYQALEGQDVQRIAKGTSSAQPLALSFWVKANVTGTYIAELQDADNNRAVSAIYTITANNVWERKSIVFPADTVGVFDNDNAGSLYLNFWLGAGSDRTSGTLQTTWASTVNANRVVGQVNVGSTVNNYWQITGIQLETGSVATQFEFKSYGQELRECQRYYYRQTADSTYAVMALGSCYNTASGEVYSTFPTAMRAVPTSIESSSLRVADTGNGYAITTVTLSSTASSKHVGAAGFTGATGMTGYRPTFLTANNNINAYLAFSAEL